VSFAGTGGLGAPVSVALGVSSISSLIASGVCVVAGAALTVVARDAYDTYKENMREYENLYYPVNVAATTITINGTSYVCNTDADRIAFDMSKNKHTYYPAILSGGRVLVAPINIDIKTARSILKLNSSTVGVMAVTDFDAKRVSTQLGGLLRATPENHGVSSGYFYHYHGRLAPNAHCWIIIF